MRLITIVGARAQFIKASVISRVISNTRSKGKFIIEKIVHTGQHYDDSMSKSFFVDLEIPRPTFNLGIGGGSRGTNKGFIFTKKWNNC